VRGDGTPIEVSIGSTEQLAAIAALGGRLNTIGSEWPNGFTWYRWPCRADEIRPGAARLYAFSSGTGSS
jgi:hypothetical protein